MTLRRIIERLRNTYCRSIGVQFMHMDDLSVRHWLQERMEGTENRLPLSRREQLRILTRLTNAAIFEEFIQKRFLGAKSFSLEGAESLIPLLDLAIEKAGEQRIRRNRAGHGPSRPAERAGQHHGQEPAADLPRVRRHRSRAAPRPRRREISPGPQHRLDHVQRARRSTCRSASIRAIWNSSIRWRSAACGPSKTASTTRTPPAGCGLLIHGDAAFAGEGIVQETLNLSQLAGYTIGGTLHVVVNNQIGFTTCPTEGRSTTYCHRRGQDAADSDLPRQRRRSRGRGPSGAAGDGLPPRVQARRGDRHVLLSPPRAQRGRRAGVHAAAAVSGDREAQESVREGYLERSARTRRHRPSEEADASWPSSTAERLERRAVGGQERRVCRHAATSPAFWACYIGGRETRSGRSRNRHASASGSCELLEKQMPECRPISIRIRKSDSMLELRREMARGNRPLDWAAGEALALASLAVEGLRIRLSGQDSDTRHVQPSPRRAARLARRPHATRRCSILPADQAPVEIYNSPLSEAGVLGFEYGYSLDCPDGLVMWEAQFGDFVQRGPSDHRPVHRQRRRRMEPAQRPGAAAAARLRREWAGTFQRPAGTVS